MALNIGQEPQRLRLGGAGMGWTMTGQPVDTRDVQINGNAPGLSSSGELTGLEGSEVAGTVTVPGQAVAFYTMPSANNPTCR